MRAKKSVCNFFCAVCVQFFCVKIFQCKQNFCVKSVLCLCKGFSVEKVLCVKKLACPYLCAQKHLRAKHRCVKTSVRTYFCVKTSVCKGICVQKQFYAQTSLCKGICANKLLCVRASVRNVPGLQKRIGAKCVTTAKTKNK